MKLIEESKTKKKKITIYIIKNIKNNVYFAKHLYGVKHYTEDIEEAMKYKDKREANETMRLFNHKENFEIIKVMQ